MPAERPTIAGGVLFTSGGDDRHDVFALDAETGAVRWQTKVPGFPGVPVTYFDHSRGLALLIFVVGQVPPNSHLQAVDANSGALSWTSTVGVGGPYDIVTDPIVVAPHNGMAQVGTADGRLVSVDVATGELRWQVQLTTQPITSRPKWVVN